MCVFGTRTAMIDTLVVMIEQQAKDVERERERKEKRPSNGQRKEKEEKNRETMLKNHLPLCVSHSPTTH